MLEVIPLLAAQLALLGAVIILREPKLLLPAVVLGLPFEIVETRLFDAVAAGRIPSAARSLFNPGQAAMIATILVVAFRFRHQPARLFPNSALLVPLGLLLALYFLGVLWSGSLVPDQSVAVLVLYGAFVLAAPALIESRRDLEWIIGAFLAVAILLSAVAIAQRALDIFTWRSVLAEGGAYRANATYHDPNNLARFLALVIPLAAGLILVTGPRRLTVYLAAPAAVLGGMAIVASTSRAGWMMLLLSTFIVLWLAPVPRYTRVKLTAVAGVALVLMVALVLASGGTDAARIRELATGLSAIGRREYLIRAGWQMFTDNPLMGVGAGHFQDALVSSYIHILPEWARGTTLSHTSIVTVMAELGLLGLAMLGFVCVRLALTLRSLFRRVPGRFNRLMVGWLAASFIGIFFHSQSEGRLLEEPFLWVLIAITIALETGPAFAAQPLPVAPAPPPDVVSVPGRTGRAPSSPIPAPGSPGHAATREA